MSEKREYLFILQGEMTAFQRAVIAKWMMRKAVQLNIGMACNNSEGGELGWLEMTDPKQHPKEGQQ